MALVAYSDESELSDDEENQSKLLVNDQQPSIKNNVKKALVGIDSIEDDYDSINKNELSYEKSPDDNTTVHTLLASIPAAKHLDKNQSKPEIEFNDIVDDVPTVKSWHINENTKVDITIENNASTSKKKPAKRKFVLAALSEFQNEDDDVEIKDQKKIKPSTKGCGLLSILPPVKKPATRLHSLVPDSVKKLTKLQPKPKLAIVADDDSDNDENVNSCDFFSLTDNKPLVPTTLIPSGPIKGPAPIVEIGPLVEIKEPVVPDTDINWQVGASENHSYDIIYDSPIQGPSLSPGIDQSELIKLAGRKNRNANMNIIKVNADDILMDRNEWMTKTLSEEKPSHSYSKKRANGPSQQSKRKHQITYLAHQAKERELELKNNWATARLSKSQTQAKYGF